MYLCISGDKQSQSQEVVMHRLYDSEKVEQTLRRIANIGMQSRRARADKNNVKRDDEGDRDM